LRRQTGDNLVPCVSSPALRAAGNNYAKFAARLRLFLYAISFPSVQRYKRTQQETRNYETLKFLCVNITNALPYFQFVLSSQLMFESIERQFNQDVYISRFLSERVFSMQRKLGRKNKVVVFHNNT